MRLCKIDIRKTVLPQLVRLVLFVPKLLFGYDVFVSYRRRDGAAYAEALLSRLSIKVAPRADFQDTDPGDRLPLRLKIGIVLTRVLVVVSTRGAHESPHVDAEVRLFVRCGGSPMRPIELSYPVEEAAWYRHCRGVPSVQETEGARATEIPSDEVVRRIVDNVGFWKRSRRQAALSAAFGIALVVAGVFAYSLTKQVADSMQKTAKAREAQAKAENARDASQKKADEQSGIAESRRLAQLAGAAGNATDSARLALQALEAAPTKEAIQAAIAVDKALSLRQEESSVMSVDDSGRLAAVADFLGNAVVMDLADGRKFSLCGYPERVEQMQFSPDGRHLASLRSTGGSRDYLVELWDVPTGKVTGSLKVSYPPPFPGVVGVEFRFFFSPDSSRLLLSGVPARLLKVPSAALIRSLDEADAVIFDETSRSMITSRLTAGVSTPAIRRTEDGNLLWTFPSKYYRWITFHPANLSLIARLDTMGQPLFFVLRLGRNGVPINPHEARAEEVIREGLFLGEARMIGPAQYDRGPVVESLFPAISTCRAFSDHKSGRSLCQPDKAVSIYDLKTKQATPLVNWGTSQIYQAEFSPDDSRVATESFGVDPVTVWDVASGQRVWEAAVPEHGRLQFSGNGDRLAIWSISIGNVTVFDARNGKKVARLEQPAPYGKEAHLPGQSSPGVLWISRDGKRMIIRTYHALRLWDVDRKKILREIDLKTPAEAKALQEIQLFQKSPTGPRLQQILKDRLQVCTN